MVLADQGCAAARGPRATVRLCGPTWEDPDTGQVVATQLTTNDVDDGSQVGPLLDQVSGPVAAFAGDGAYDRDDVYSAVIERHPDAAVIVPRRSSAVPSETAGTEPTRRDLHLQFVAERGPRFAATPQQPPSRRPQRRPRQRHRRKPVLPPSAFATMDARTCALRSLSNKRGSRSSRSAPEAFDALFCG